MLEVLPISSPHVIGVRVRGQVGHTDIAEALKEFKAKVGSERKLGIYIEIETFEGFSLRGFLRELGLLSKHFSRLTRIALVSDLAWYQRTALVIGRKLPNVDLEHFTPIQKDEALIWACDEESEIFED
jgi:hypothetical protein